MPNKCALIAPHENVARIARELCAEHHLDFDIVSCSTVAVAAELAKKYAADGATVLVSRGGMATAVAREVSLPVVSVEISFMDLMDALYQVKSLDKPVALIMNAELSFDIEKVRRLLEMDIEAFNVPAGGNAIDTIALVKRKGYEVMVGGPAPVYFAERAGMRAILFESSRESIRNALLRADELARLEDLSLFQDNTIRGILDYAREGIVITNESGAVVLLNKSAEAMLQVEREKTLGRDYNAALPLLPVQDVKNLAAGRMRHGRVHGAQLLQNAAPFFGGGRTRGVISTLYSARLLDAYRAGMEEEVHLKGHVAQHSFDNIITRSPLMRRVIERAESFARVDSTILVTGETGTGKELFAQSIHNAGARRSRPFVAVNCASIPDSILESELFGYESGAFTGAAKGGRKGYFEMAEGGTLFLDEIGEIAPNLQSKLLRVLQQREIVRVGGDRVIPVDIRIIVATLADMEEEVRERRFRRDLYYRLNVLRLSLPPLRERLEDLPLLIDALAARTAGRLGLSPLKLQNHLLARFEAYPWHGNVRELENAVERLTILQAERAVSREELDAVLEDMQLGAPGEAGGALTLAEQEKRRILGALRLYGGDRTKAGKALGISPSTLWRRMKEWNIQIETNISK